MKKFKKCYQYSKAIVLVGMLATSFNSYAQRASVMADTKLGVISLVDEYGMAINATDISADKIITLKIPVVNNNHGKAIPAGSAKIKIGLGSKLVLDPNTNINNTQLSNYFSWTFANNGGQVQITGDLINALPASITSVEVSFKVKALMMGNSTITANFLITNHNTAIILSDENGDNNAASLSYRVSEKVQAPTPLGDAADVVMYPNPVANTKTVIVEAKIGEFKGRYTVAMYDANGKKIQNNAIELNGVKRFNYTVGSLAAGTYVLQINKGETVKPYLLKFVKL